MEQFSRETVAPPIVPSLRGEEWSTPIWREAFDDEGSRGRRILQNPPRRPNCVVGAVQMSLAAAPNAHCPEIQRVKRRGLVSHSSSFFTGLCEKFPAGAASLALLAARHKRL